MQLRYNMVMSSPQPSTLYFYPTIFERFPEVVAIHSLLDQGQPAGFSMLRGGSEEELAANRATLVKAAGFPPNRLAVPKQVHGDTILELSDTYTFESRPEGDALIADEPGWLIGAAVADCVAVLLYDPAHHAIAAVHSGWRGSAQNIVGKTVQALNEHYHSETADLYTFVSPAPAQEEFEVERTVVSDRFEPKYSTPGASGKAWFDNKAVVHDQLLDAGIPPNQIEIDPRSTISDPRLHSARRDGEQSGRMIVAIGLR